MKIGIIRERKTPPDRRVVFSPNQLQSLQQQYDNLSFVVEPSPIRVFSDKQYEEVGVKIDEELSDCDVLLGVKEVPINALTPNKSYFFFSHTIKQQPYNRQLLQEILAKNIRLYDHEVIKDDNNLRLVGFGRYAGLVGAYNGFRAYGKRHQLFNLPKADNLEDLDALKKELDQLELPDFNILLTGKGKVAKGAREILNYLNIREVSVEDYLHHDFGEAVFCQIGIKDYNKHKANKPFSFEEFVHQPENYKSNFRRFTKKTDFYIAGHFYADGAPYLFTRDDAKRQDFRINTIADISCDIDGPVASTIRSSTIANPFYGYDPQSEEEVAFDDPDAITVMAVDNLPCELPKDASEGFGEMFAQHVMPAFFNDDKDGILRRAKITENGKLSSHFTYLSDYVS
ncbi:MAG: NAD(P)-dependent oxidoreductase [Psychroflexus sp.]|jgi:alanine dehydrogenase|nr:NAD(P)-dependent oxidoreductase [Psychroflexus sp.]MDR9447794.1 NAD(P)-dependent oxidoreductase [Psychroflexus sp.]